ncbi:hypothetical protein B0H15DRAFT_945688 [Mycena belliarum]|uniref:Uncharacterized protein n=1 Tax=Mycena belliarum TaxID=1033014 RepID=A0AAD6UGJ4_9AGAR|nr:hypothetical protein B0H15DRAFT_945688 [Mycena belliae]
MAEHPYNCSTRLGAIETPVLGDRIPVAGYTILWEPFKDYSPLIRLRVSLALEMCTSTGSTLYLKTSPFATKFHPNTDAPWHHRQRERELGRGSEWRRGRGPERRPEPEPEPEWGPEQGLP